MISKRPRAQARGRFSLRVRILVPWQLSRYFPAMTVFMRLIALFLVVSALLLLGADAVTSLEKGGEITVRSLDMIWAMLDKADLDSFKAWIQNNASSMAQGVYSALALPGWAVTGVLGVLVAFIFGRKH